MDYQKTELDDGLVTSPPRGQGRRKKNGSEESDTEFAAAGETEEEDDDEGVPEYVDANELQSGRSRHASNSLAKGTQKDTPKANPGKPVASLPVTRSKKPAPKANSLKKFTPKKQPPKPAAPAKTPKALKQQKPAPVGKTKVRKNKVSAFQAKGSKVLVKSNKTPRSKNNVVKKSVAIQVTAKSATNSPPLQSSSEPVDGSEVTKAVTNAANPCATEAAVQESSGTSPKRTASARVSSVLPAKRPLSPEATSSVNEDVYAKKKKKTTLTKTISTTYDRIQAQPQL